MGGCTRVHPYKLTVSHLDGIGSQLVYQYQKFTYIEDFSLKLEARTKNLPIGGFLAKARARTKNLVTIYMLATKSRDAT